MFSELGLGFAINQPLVMIAQSFGTRGGRGVQASPGPPMDNIRL